MEWIQTFRSSKVALSLAGILEELKPKPMRLMEVCGTHTVAIAHNGIRELIPPGVELTSGPGCPVCVTSVEEIDTFIAASKISNTIITTFGDLIKVPGSYSSLSREMSENADIRIVYSPLDAVEIARNNPGKEVIFLGVGFETTTPTIAASVLQATSEKITNFSIISAHKLMPPALEALVSDPEIKINGLLCPGHVSIMIGAEAYKPIVEKYNIPCVIAGFEAADILHAVVLLVKQIESGKPAKVDISYQRAVYEKGNTTAMSIMNQIFEPCSAHWRGFGDIDSSGLKLREEYQSFNALARFDIQVEKGLESPDCQCGNVLKGLISPPDCQLYSKACTPEDPIGPCMVSSEGACASFYRYKR